MSNLLSKEDLKFLRAKYDNKTYYKKNVLTGEIKNRLVYFYSVKTSTWGSNYYDRHRVLVININNGQVQRFGINDRVLTTEFNTWDSRHEEVVYVNVQPNQIRNINFFKEGSYAVDSNAIHQYYDFLAGSSWSCFNGRSYYELNILVSDLANANVPIKGLARVQGCDPEVYKIRLHKDNIRNYFGCSSKDLRIILSKIEQYSYVRKTLDLKKLLSCSTEEAIALKEIILYEKPDDSGIIFYQKIAKQLLKAPDERQGMLSRLYVDYKNMLDTLTRINDVYKKYPTIPSIETIERYHNEILKFYEKYRNATPAEMNERYKKSFYPITKAFEYKNDDYSIIACADLDDLVYEGSCLHHCVGSYRKSVSFGTDQILFLRKNSEPNIPYFTINLDEKNAIRQIHGKYNCNVPIELKPFIDEWINKFNIKGNNWERVCCAKQ